MGFHSIKCRGNLGEKMITEKYMNIMKEIRGYYEETGSKLFYSVEDFGDHMNPYYPSNDGKLHIHTYYDGVRDLVTPEGSHSVLGSRIGGNDKDAMKKIIDRFGLIKEKEWGLFGEKFISYLVTKE
jgi:hypothetical protein